MSNDNELIEGEDYYLENGKWVFTTKYLLDRGFCCQSGCRHCPYGLVKDNSGAGPSGESDSQ